MADLRRCIGSAKFGIEAHEAPVGDFPTQPSQKDGLGRMCKTHWREYVQALGRARTAAKAAPASAAEGAHPPQAGVSLQSRRLAGFGAEPTVQSKAAARVAKKRAARVAKPAPEKVTKVRKAKALIDAIDVLPGPEHVAAIATDEAQAALEVLGTANHGEPVLAEPVIA